MGLGFVTGVLEGCLDNGEERNTTMVEVIVSHCVQLWVDFSESDVVITNMII